MVCIYCGGKTQIINSRPQKRLNHTWRRRECYACQAIFTTLESADYSGSIVVRGTGTGKHTPLEPFNRDKLYVSVLKALGHRQTAVEDATALCATIIAKLLLQTAEAALNPQLIIDTTHETLVHFDKAAAVQYLAYHQ